MTTEWAGYENPFIKHIDKAHVSLGFHHNGINTDVWRDKYRWRDEASLMQSAERVVRAVCVNEPEEFQILTFQAIQAGLWIPAGRILAGAGTTKRVTLMNCYVNQKIEDSMESIMKGNTIAALTMQQGGGIGTDFSTIRPARAILERTGTAASGPLPFMHMWNSMCATIRSAGDRRGAMMGTMCDTHPDLPAFVKAKHTQGVLTNFNISVLVSDAFMEAVREDQDWLLHFNKAPVDKRDQDCIDLDFFDEETGEQQYVYSIWKARELWEMITKSSFEYSEPGIIFIDRVNDLNNLWYCEEIHCTNPCGEQPLPPHGTCNLGSLFLSRMVTQPFTQYAAFNYDLLREIVRIGVRFLDDVIDVTNYPLVEQMQEEVSKRRLGLGFTGLADVFAQMGVPYGSYKSAEIADQIMKVIAEESYLASVELAKTRGSFPLFDADQFLAPNTFAAKRLSKELQEQIRAHGIRNGLILTVAPTGTISATFGNPASGLEPIFALEQDRSVLQPDNSWKVYERVENYSVALYRQIFSKDAALPMYFTQVSDLTVQDHLIIQSKIQHWTDASVSKTINCPKDISYEAFVNVYDIAYSTGCKGCTTYKESEVRGSILRASGTKAELAEPVVRTMKRPKVLAGRTYQIKWPSHKAALYLVINAGEDGYPWEIFITSKDASYSEWTMALTLMITAIFKKGGDVSFVASELKQIQSLRDGAWIDKQYFGSLPSYIGYLIERHMNPDAVVEDVRYESVPEEKTPTPIRGTTCFNCSAPAVIKEAGCERCLNCGWSKCD